MDLCRLLLLVCALASLVGALGCSMSGEATGEEESFEGIARKIRQRGDPIVLQGDGRSRVPRIPHLQGRILTLRVGTVESTGLVESRCHREGGRRSPLQQLRGRGQVLDLPRGRPVRALLPARRRFHAQHLEGASRLRHRNPAGSLPERRPRGHGEGHGGHELLWEQVQGPRGEGSGRPSRRAARGGARHGAAGGARVRGRVLVEHPHEPRAGEVDAGKGAHWDLGPRAVQSLGRVRHPRAVPRGWLGRPQGPRTAVQRRLLREAQRRGPGPFQGHREHGLFPCGLEARGQVRDRPDAHDGHRGVHRLREEPPYHA